MSRRRPIALTIAGSDSSGGAGIQADLKTFSMLGVYGASVITALTAQNTVGVTGILPTPPEFIASQFDAVASDLAICAAKTGMLGGAAAVGVVVDCITRHGLKRLVVDPVMIATSGAALIDEAAIDALRGKLIPLAELITPNLPEAARLLEMTEASDPAEMEVQARLLQARFGARGVLIKGGHGQSAQAVDILVATPGAAALALAKPRLATKNTHGTGCTLSAAITALLARDEGLAESVAQAKCFVWDALAAADGLGIGKGHGPLNHLFSIPTGPGKA